MPRNNLKHGMTRTPTHNSWRAMIERCSNPNAIQYSDYGGRGITVCERWRKFENFYADMGLRPTTPRHTIDRFPNPNGNYEPGNCRWATYKEQQNNKTNNRLIEAFGERRTITTWAERTGLDKGCIHERLSLGWDPERALSQPSDRTAGRFKPSIIITVGSESLSVSEWAKRLGISSVSVYNRINNGWPPDIAVTAPPRTRFSRSRS